MWGVGNSKKDKKGGAEGFFHKKPFCSERNRNGLTPNPSPKARGDLPSGWLPPPRGSRWGASGELEGGFFASLRVELTNVGPPIIWKTVGGYGENCLLLVEKTLHEDVVCTTLATIEHQLDIRCLASLPVLIAVLHLVWVLGVAVGSVDAHQHGEGTKTGVVTEAEVGDVVAAALDDCISLADDVLEDRNHLVLWTEHP